MITQLFYGLRRYFFALQGVNFIAPFLIRLYLGGLLIVAGLLKLDVANALQFFSGHGIHLDAWCVASISYGEIVLGACILVGFLTRLSSFIMLISALALSAAYSWTSIYITLVAGTLHAPVHGFAATLGNVLYPWMNWTAHLLGAHGDNLSLMSPLYLLGATTTFLLMLSLFFTGGGRYLSLDYWVRFAKKTYQPKESDRVYVGNLHYKVDRKLLTEEFKKFGELTDVKLIRGNDGRSRCFAFVAFKDAADAQKAIQKMDGYKIIGRAIKVSQANKK